MTNLSTRTVVKKGFNAFLNFSHHRGAGTKAFHPPQFSQLCRGCHIDPPNERCILVLYLHRPELIEGDHRVDSSARIILEIRRLLAITRRLPVGCRQTDRRHPIGIEQLPGL
jgi:hypothetical protein